MNIPTINDWLSEQALNGGYDPFRRDDAFQAAILRHEICHSVLDANEARRAFCSITGLGVYWEGLRRAQKLSASPSWADKSKIAKLYRKAASMRLKTGRSYHVDHIVPLQSARVCGLHCEQNLRIVLSTTNLKKSNKFI